MKVKVIIGESFQLVTGGIETVEVEGRTVGQCLKEAMQRYPGLKDLWFRSDNEIAPYMMILINRENILSNKLVHRVKDGDEIYPMLVIGGG
jgi:molybdopterin converting factor small subunit